MLNTGIMIDTAGPSIAPLSDSKKPFGEPLFQGLVLPVLDELSHILGLCIRKQTVLAQDVVAFLQAVRIGPFDAGTAPGEVAQDRID